jgi:hypothetical protein
MKWLSWGFALVLAVPGCALRSGPAPEADLVPSEECVAFPDGGRTFAPPLVVAVTEPVTAENAPLPANESERIVFSQLYETLVTLDCTGRVRPGLARSWSVSEGGREWTFRLREDARFSNGAPLLARNVGDAWEQVSMRYRIHELPRAPLNPWTWVSPDSVRSVGDDVVIVSLTEPLGDDPVVFAHPALSIIKRSSHLGWPLGSAPYLLSMADRKEITLIPNRFAPEALQARVSLVFRMRPGADPRDVLADKPDALLVGAASGLQYASRLPDYGRSVPGGERTYYVLSENLPGAVLDPAVLSRLRDDLAGEVVLSDARPVAEGVAIHPSTAWIAKPSRPSLGGGYDGSVLAFPEDDGEAGRIAERITVWAAHHADPAPDPAMKGSPTTFGLAAAAFDRLLDRGAGWGFILSLRSSDPLFSREERAFFDSLRWFLKPRALRRGREGDREPAPVAVPLVVTVSHLVLRDGVSDVLADGSGSFLFYRAGRGEGTGRREGATP